MRRPTSITVLSLNPTIDVTLHLPGLAEGEEYVDVPEVWEPGGKGANVSRYLAARGITHTGIFVVGRENASRFLAALEYDGVFCEPVYVEGSMRENLTLTIPGRPSVRIIRKGFQIHPWTLAQVDELLLGQEMGSWAVIGGRMPAGLEFRQLLALFQKMHARGTRVVLDTSSLTCEQVSALQPWLIKPNWQELELLAEQRLRDWDDVERAAVTLQEKGIPRLLVSMGEKGAYYTGPEGRVRVSAPPVAVKSTVGAGDVLLAEFLLSLWDGRALANSLMRAAAMASYKCTGYGNIPPDEPALEDLFAQMDLELLR